MDIARFWRRTKRNHASWSAADVTIDDDGMSGNAFTNHDGRIQFPFLFGVQDGQLSLFAFCNVGKYGGKVTRAG